MESTQIARDGYVSMQLSAALEISDEKEKDDVNTDEGPFASKPVEMRPVSMMLCMRLFLVLLCCGLAAGVLPGQALFVKLFADGRIFESFCPERIDKSKERRLDPKQAFSQATVVDVVDGTNVGDATKVISITPIRDANVEGTLIDSKERVLHVEKDLEIASHAQKSQEGACKEQFVALTGVMGVGQAISIAFFTPIGLFFDRWGAKKSGTIGAALCSSGLFLIWASLVGAAQGYDSITSSVFVGGVLLCDFGSMLNSFALMGLIWHFPGRQAFIISLSQATYQVSSFLPILMEAVINRSSLTVKDLMLYYCFVSLVIIYACWKLVPSQDEYYREAKRALGIPLPKPPQRIEPLKMLSRACVVLKHNTRDHCSSVIALGIGYAFPQFYQSLAAPYGEMLFGAREAGDHLAELYVSVNGLVGLVLAPFIGSLADCFGLSFFVLTFGLLLAVCAGTCGIANWSLQAVCVLSTVLFLTLVSIFCTRYILKYSPPNRVGTVQGIYYLAAIVISMPPTFCGLAAVEVLPKGPDAYRFPMYICGSMGTISMLLYGIYYYRNPPPETPILLPDDELELSKNFGCNTLEEVMEVLHVATREKLIKMLSSTDPDVTVQMIKSIDTERMMQMMAKKSAEDMAAMLEDGMPGEEEEDEQEEEIEVLDDPPSAMAPEATNPLLGDMSPRSVEAGIVSSESCRHTEQTGATEESEKTNEKEIARGCAQADVDESGERQIRVKCDSLIKMVGAKDKQGLKDYLLKESVEDMWLVQLDMEARFPEAERKKIDKDFEKLIPGVEFAKLLRQRPELKSLIQKLMKRHLDRKIASLRRKRM